MSYAASTRHPWACLVFLVPILAAYEIGVYTVGGPNAANLRNGADAWLRWALDTYGLQAAFAAPLLIIGWFTLLSAYHWQDRPERLFSTLFGMLVESVAFGFLLWMISRNFPLILQQCGLNVSPQEAASLLTFVGAGIYEEVIFRLVLFSGLVFFLRLVFLPTPIAVLVGALAGALLFSAAHHAGPFGEAIKTDVFLFRTVAGLFFTALYIFRGFGVAVGAHVAYDVLVGVVLQPKI